MELQQDSRKKRASSKKKKRRKVEVVEFVDPSVAGAQRKEKRRRSDQRKRDRSALAGALAEADEGATKPVDEASEAELEQRKKDFKRMRREVLQLGANEFDLKDRKAWEHEQLRQLGGHAVHKVKMPGRMYRGVVAARERRATAREKEELASGVVTGRATALAPFREKRAARKKAAVAGIARLAGSRSLETQGVKDGVFYVSKSMQAGTSRGRRGGPAAAAPAAGIQGKFDKRKSKVGGGKKKKGPGGKKKR